MISLLLRALLKQFQNKIHKPGQNSHGCVLCQYKTFSMIDASQDNESFSHEMEADGVQWQFETAVMMLKLPAFQPHHWRSESAPMFSRLERMRRNQEADHDDDGELMAPGRSLRKRTAVARVTAQCGELMHMESMVAPLLIIDGTNTTYLGNWHPYLPHSTMPVKNSL